MAEWQCFKLLMLPCLTTSRRRSPTLSTLSSRVPYGGEVKRADYGWARPLLSASWPDRWRQLPSLVWQWAKIQKLSLYYFLLLFFFFVNTKSRFYGFLCHRSTHFRWNKDEEAGLNHFRDTKDDLYDANDGLYDAKDSSQHANDGSHSLKVGQEKAGGAEDGMAEGCERAGKNLGRKNEGRRRWHRTSPGPLRAAPHPHL